MAFLGSSRWECGVDNVSVGQQLGYLMVTRSWHTARTEWFGFTAATR